MQVVRFGPDLAPCAWTDNCSVHSFFRQLHSRRLAASASWTCMWNCAWWTDKNTRDVCRKSPRILRGMRFLSRRTRFFSRTTHLRSLTKSGRQIGCELAEEAQTASKESAILLSSAKVRGIVWPVYQRVRDIETFSAVFIYIYKTVMFDRVFARRVPELCNGFSLIKSSSLGSSKSRCSAKKTISCLSKIPVN